MGVHGHLGSVHRSAYFQTFKYLQICIFVNSKVVPRFVGLNLHLVGIKSPLDKNKNKHPCQACYRQLLLAGLGNPGHEAEEDLGADEGVAGGDQDNQGVLAVPQADAQEPTWKEGLQG